MLRMLKLYDKLNSFEYHTPYYFISDSGQFDCKEKWKIIDIFYLMWVTRGS